MKLRTQRTTVTVALRVFPRGDVPAQSWSTLGNGMYGTGLGSVWSLRVLNGQLCAGGDFIGAGGNESYNITRWGPTGIPGDTNCDCAVNVTDLVTALSHFGSASSAPFADGDVDGDGVIDLRDLSLLLAHFGETCP